MEVKEKDKGGGEKSVEKIEGGERGDGVDMDLNMETFEGEFNHGLCRAGGKHFDCSWCARAGCDFDGERGW